MKYNEWISNIKNNGLLCDIYTQKVDKALSKKQIMDIVLDANGASYLMQMQSKGYPLPYETIIKEFGSYINGRYKAEYKNDKGNGYTSSMYCCYTDESFIELDTTQTILLGCNTVLYVKDNSIAQVYADKNCDIIIYCPKSSRLIVDYWKGAKIKVIENEERVTLKERE